MFTLLFIAMAIAITVAWLLIRRLQERPWTEIGVIAGSQDMGGRTSSAPKVGLWVFLGVVTSVFSIFIGAYFMRIDTTHGGIAAGHMHAWVPVDEPALLWLNTLVLVAASIAIQLAHSHAGRTGLADMRRYFNAAGLLTMLFLLGQGYAWHLLYSTGQYGVASPAFSFFVLLTAIHGLHLLGGLYVWSRTASRLRAGLEDADLIEVGAIRQSVQLCATYWHYLLLIWIVLFAILLST
jgi:cytochrome c oxidase subunit 3